MSYFISALITSLSIFPSWVVAIILGVLAFFVVLLVIKIVGFILDAIPFL